MKRTLLASSAIAVVFMGSAASAQQFYLGVGVDRTDSNYEFDYTPPVITGPSLLGGYRAPMGAGFWGVEADLSFPSNNEDIDRIMRLKGLVGKSFGNVDAFASLGVAAQTGNFADFVQQTEGGSGAISGVTYGIGAEFPLSSKLRGRVEVIQDQFDNSGKAGDWSNTSIRAAALFSF